MWLISRWLRRIDAAQEKRTHDRRDAEAADDVLTARLEKLRLQVEAYQLEQGEQSDNPSAVDPDK